MLSIVSLSEPRLIADKCEVSSARYLESGLATFSAIKRNIEDRSVNYCNLNRCSLKSAEMGTSPSGQCRLVIGQNELSNGKRQRGYGYYVSSGRINNRRRWWRSVMTLRIRRNSPGWEPLHVQRVVRPADHGITPPHHPDILKQPRRRSGVGEGDDGLAGPVSTISEPQM